MINYLIMQNNLAPICLFVYNRIEETKLTISALQANFLANESDLIVFSDGYKDKNDAHSVRIVRDFVSNISGFRSVKIIESFNNKGLAKSVIEGVSLVLENSETIIVLEDDLITTPNFLDFMNQALDFYNSYDRVISISGFTLPIDFKNEPTCDIYFSYRASSWGWATWKDRWFDIDWEVTDYTDFSLSRKLQVEFNRGGDDMCRMLKKQMNNDIDSWAIRFCYHQFKHDKLTVMPRVSKVRNIGLNDRATNTKFRSREYSAILDIGAESQFYFSNSINVNDKINKQFRFYYSKYYKIKHRVLNYFS